MLENSTYTSSDQGQIILDKQDYENLLKEKVNLEIKVEYLNLELAKLRRMIFGAKSERFVPISTDQLALFDLESKQKQEPQSETISYTRNKPEQKSTTGHGRLLLPAHLPRVDHVIEPEGKVEGAKKIGEEITEVLEYTPGKLYVNRYIRPKYVLPEEKGIVIGMLPSLPIPRGNAGAGLLAHIMVSKYVDHLPFYRQVQQFKREDVQLSESTLNGWFTGGCKLIEPLYEHHKKQVQQAQYLMADETPIPVQTKDKPGSTHKGYLWVYYAPLERMVLFDYRKSRSREGPVEFLKDFKGILQTDGYEAYRIFENKQGITLLACMAHARRKFDEAKGNDPERSQYMLALMQQLYALEREARERELSHEDRQQLRQEKSVPVLQQMERWMKQEIQKVLPQSAIGKAIAYTLSLWPRLIRYTEDGRAEIDNNLVENSIRPVAVGRKNYLFAGSHEGAGRAALIYSMLGTCKQHNVNPFLWLRDVFTCLPEAKQSQLNRFLPQNWSSKAD
jgi:transposase